MYTEGTPSYPKQRATAYAALRAYNIVVVIRSISAIEV